MSGVGGSEWQVALLRGVNVGHAKRVAMADLRRLFEELGYSDVRTLLNSGNVVCTASKKGGADHVARIEKAIAGSLGVSTRVVILSGEELEEALRENPLAAIATDPSRHQIMALRDSEAAARLKPLLKEHWAPEALAIRKRFAYIWCLHGTVKGRLWPEANRTVGDAGTSRNLATMTKLLALMRNQP